MKTIEIGELVTWKVGSHVREGIWMKNYDNDHDVVMCTKVGNNVLAMKCNVPKELLKSMNQ